MTAIRVSLEPMFKAALVTTAKGESNPDEWIENSHVIQWLRFHASKAGGTGSIPGWELRSYRLQLKIMHVSTNIEDPQYCNEDLAQPNK